MAKRGPRRNKHQKAKHQQAASDLRHNHGTTLRGIAEKIGLSYEQVRLDLKELDDAALESAKLTSEQALIESLAKLRYAQTQALAAWTESMQPAETHQTKTTDDSSEETFTVKGQSGNPGHLRNFTNAVEAEAKLRGLYDLGDGKGDESADRLLELHELLEAARKQYDTKKTTSTES